MVVLTASMHVKNPADFDLINKCNTKNVRYLEDYAEAIDLIPKKYKNEMRKKGWEINIVSNIDKYLPKKAKDKKYILGVTYPARRQIYVDGSRTEYYHDSVKNVFVHEFAHAIDYELNYPSIYEWTKYDTDEDLVELFAYGSEYYLNGVRLKEGDKHKRHEKLLYRIYKKKNYKRVNWKKFKFKKKINKRTCFYTKAE